MRIEISDLARYKVQCFDDKGNSRDHASVKTMSDVTEQINVDAAAGFKNAVIYTVSEIRKVL